jgi:hypothetical protein
MEIDDTPQDGLIFDHLDLQPDEVDYVIYHNPCSDGFTSALCVNDYFKKKIPGKQITYYPTTYGKSPPYEELHGKNVLICDFSYKKPELLKILEVAKKLAILDHHKTAQNELKDIDDKYKLFRMDHSGAYLTWRYFNRIGPVPKMIIYVEDNDIWLKKQYKTHEFTAFMFTLPFTFEEYGKLMDDKYVESEVFTQGTGMVRQNNTIIANAIKYAAPKFIQIKDKYYFVSYLNSSVLKSELGHHAFEEYPNIDFSATYSINDYTNTTSFSLRSLESAVDVSEIAQIFGGGGHAQASGLTCSTVTNTLPVKHIDTIKSYTVLTNIYFKPFTYFNGELIETTRIVLLNTQHFKKHLGKYLLQQRYVYKKKGADGVIFSKSIQECTSIEFNRTKKAKKHNAGGLINNDNDPNFNIENSICCDMSIVWNYDGENDKIWYTINFNKHNPTKIPLLNKYICDKIKADVNLGDIDINKTNDTIIFTTKGFNMYF